MKRTFFILLLSFFPILFAAASASAAQPNVIIVLADDLGYGDLSCYGAVVHQTPHIDRLAAEGLRFTQGFATSSTCTPSRFALLTGLYPCRQKGVQILPGNSPLIISPEHLTLARTFQNAGYRTGAVGKWHLGLGVGVQDWNQEIRPGLRDLGFDQSFIMAATNDRTPTVFIENGCVANLDPKDPLFVNYKQNFEGEPEYHKNPELVTKQKSLYGHDGSVHNGVGRIGFQKGGVSARWIDEEMAGLFRSKTEDFIRESVQESKPFFLYYALHQPHVPRMPGAQFAGKSPLGLRGDVILEADWQVGELVRLLEELKISENTIVIFTSDNGPVLNDGYAELAVEKNKETGHTPSGVLRGGKYSNYNGGAQVPFIVYWPGTVAAGTSDALVCHVDFIASFSALLGQKVPEGEAYDSQNVLDALLGRCKNGRSELLVNSRTLRTPDWHLVPGKKALELYDLTQDPSETINAASTHLDLVRQMMQRLQQIQEFTGTPQKK